MGVGTARPSQSLIEGGNFEALFRSLRTFIFEFIAKETDIARWLAGESARPWNILFQHPYWPVAFDLFFSNSLLRAMFGSAAIQHGPAESYSEYFRLVFERGLRRRDRRDNYFLHHLLLGHYPNAKRAWPIFLRRPPKTIKMKTFQETAQEFEDYSPYDFVGLSNIFDWSAEDEIRPLAARLQKQLKPGACVAYRQLNNGKNFRRFFGPSFRWLEAEARRLHQRDRSLFYSSLHIARKSNDPA